MIRSSLAALLLALAGCASHGGGAMPVDLRPGVAASVAPGARLALPDGSTLHYVGIGDDSRCPPAVTCIRAGDADAVFEHRPAGALARMLELNTEHPREADLGTWRLSLLSLGRGSNGVAEVRVDPLVGR